MKTTRLGRRVLSLISTGVLAALLLSACTAGFAYNRLDWLIPWYVDGYVDLTRTQRKTLQSQLAPRLEQHRYGELARYVEILDRIDGDLENEVDAATVRNWAETVLDAAQRVERSMMEAALEFGVEISDEQVREFMDSLWERQEEYEEEFLGRSDAEYAEDDYENLTDFLERFTGRLSAGQRAVLREAAERLQRFDRAWLEERRNWLKTLEPLLLARERGWQADVMAAYEARLRDRTPDYRSVFDHNLQTIAGAYARVLSMMDERQRISAREELDRMRQTLLKLMARPGSARRGTTPCAPCYVSQINGLLRPG